MPSSSLVAQASIGSSLVIAVMLYKKQGLKVFRKLHPGGTLSKKLLSSGDLMTKAPFISENYKILSSKITSVSSGKQKKLTKEIKKAKILGLI